MQEKNCHRGKNPGPETTEQKEKLQKDSLENDKIEDVGQLTLSDNEQRKIHLFTIIGEIEGHDNLPANTKTTKYEHLLPRLASIEDSDKIDGVLVLLNTMGGDVDAGLAIAEMIASISKPTVSLVLGGSHSIGVPLAVSTDYSFIVPSGTMLVHPVRMSGMTIGVKQTFDYFKRIQDRITGFISSHSSITKERLEEMMMETEEMTKDLGTILIGQEAVREGLINEVGGMKEAMQKLYQLIDERKEKSNQ